MQYFKNYQLFEADEKPKEEPVDAKTADGVTEPLPTTTVTETFRNTFSYNKIDINETFETTMKSALEKLEEFMKTENKDNKVEVIQIKAQGYASWVPTQYQGGNAKLSLDRATSISNEVRKRVEAYFASKNISDINFVKSDLKGFVDFENSKKVFHEFIEKHYKNSPNKLIEELKKTGTETVWVVKNIDEKYDVQTVYQLAEKDVKKIEKIRVEEANAQKIYEALVKTPLYVKGTAKLKAGAAKIEDEYRKFTQYAIVEIIVNDPNKEVKKPEEKKDPIDIRNISFEKDTDVVDAVGKTNLNLLTAFLQKLDVNNVKNFLLLGHAEADSELNKSVFDPTKKERLKDAKGKETIMTEAELADLRFILSIARIKTVYRAIENLDATKNLISGRKLLMMPAGTIFGDKLNNPRIVQIVILMNDGSVINTEEAVDYTPELNSPTFQKINTNIKTLGYAGAKLVQGLMGVGTFGNPVPSHIEMAKDPNKLANFKKQYI